MKIKLFGDRVEPSCHYCEMSVPTSNKETISCKKFGSVSPYHHCKYYRYAPLKRIPKRAAELPKYTRDDFKL